MIQNANEEVYTDSVNEEEELSSNEADHDTGTTEGESEEVSEEPVGEEVESDRIEVSKSEYDKLRREAHAAKRLREKTSHKDSSESKEGGASLDQELVSRTFLAAQSGITDKEIQNEALRLAEKFGMSIVEAMDDTDISTRLKNLQKQKETRQAIARNNGGVVSKDKGVDYYLGYFKKNGDFPPNTPNSMIAKVTEKLAY